MKGLLAFAMYKPHDGKRAEFMAILDQHVPLLRELELITARDNYILEMEDGTLIDVFEWVSEEAKDLAHKHPAVGQLWGEMMKIATFPHLKDLANAEMPFPGFPVLR